MFSTAFSGELPDVNRSGWQRMCVTNGCTTNGGGSFGGVVRLVPPSRDPYRYKEKRFTFSFISTKPGVTETSADAIALPMAFDACRLRCHVPWHFK